MLVYKGLFVVRAVASVDMVVVVAVEEDVSIQLVTFVATRAPCFSERVNGSGRGKHELTGRYEKRWTVRAQSRHNTVDNPLLPGGCWFFHGER